MKELTKRITRVILCVVLMATLIAGCGTKTQSKIVVRVAGLKGPTFMGLLNMQEKTSLGEAGENYEFAMYTGADEILPLLIKGDIDIALIPANVASILYNKTKGGIKVVDINTLGVLYMVSGDASICSIKDLEGRTIYLTGKGTTPDYVLRYLLEQNGLDDTMCTLEYKSEATEVAAVLANNSDAVGLLPQPFVTAAMLQNENLKIVIDTTKEWALTGKSLITGVTVARNEFIDKNEDALKVFLKEHKESVDAINADVEHGAQLAVSAEIVAKEPIALKAIPACNITYIDGNEMMEQLNAYLTILNDFNPEAVGGQLPSDSFYYIGD